MAARGWSEHVHATSADVLASYRGGDLDQRAAVTRLAHPSGGAAWYVSAGFEPADLSGWLISAVRASSARPVLLASPPDGVEVCRRDGERAYLFLINHADGTRTVDIRTADSVAWHVAATGEPAGPTVSVAAGDVLILQSPTSTREPAS
jgi:beta-galactosidase